MKKLLLCLLVLGVSGAYAMVDAGWSEQDLLGTRTATQSSVQSMNPVNPPQVDASWKDQDLLGSKPMNSNPSATYDQRPTNMPSVDSRWSIQDLQ